MTYEWLVGAEWYVVRSNLDDRVAGGVGRHHCRPSSVAWQGAAKPTQTARDILDERYARGEIDREEYLKRKQDIFLSSIVDF